MKAEAFAIFLNAALEGLREELRDALGDMEEISSAICRLKSLAFAVSEQLRLEPAAARREEIRRVLRGSFRVTGTALEATACGRGEESACGTVRAVVRLAGQIVDAGLDALGPVP